MPSNELSKQIRNSRMFLSETYFWTDTVKDWRSILYNDTYKQLIIDTLKELTIRKKIKVYGFVIMPNHIHLIWKMVAKNGKEFPHASFNKYTSHQIVDDLKKTNKSLLIQFEVNDIERNHRIWQRDPLAVLMDDVSKLEQKLDYIHENPLQEHWDLCSKPEDYRWSSSKFYETGIDGFGFLTHYKEDF